MTKYKKKTNKIYKHKKLPAAKTVDTLVADYRQRPAQGLSPLYVDKAVDKRSKVVHRFNRIYNNILDDMGGGDPLSEGQRQIAQQCAAFSVIQECFTQKFLENPDFMFQTNGKDRTNLDDYNKLVNTVTRMYKTVGLERKVKDITDMSLADYVETHHSGDEVSDEEEED